MEMASGLVPFAKDEGGLVSSKHKKGRERTGLLKHAEAILKYSGAAVQIKMMKQLWTNEGLFQRLLSEWAWKRKP